MANMRDLFYVSETKVKNAMFEHLIYSYPKQKFWDKILEMEEAWNVPIREVLREELFLRGIVTDRSDKCRTGPEIRKKIKQFLFENPLAVDDWKVTNKSLRNRQIDSLAKLKEFGEENHYLILYFRSEEALVMWDKQETGVFVNAGRSFAYVYMGGFSFNPYRDMLLIGYFQLSTIDVIGKLNECISGRMKDRTDALSERRKSYIVRRKRRLSQINMKRKASYKV